MVVVNLKLSRHKVQHATDLFADACLVALALTADFLFRRHIMMMLDLRQRIETQLAVGTLLSATSGFLLSGCGPRGIFGTGRDFTVGQGLLCGRLRLGEQRAHVKQMLLLCISNVSFAPRSVHPAAQQTQFVDRFLMIFAKLIEILCSAIQHLFEIGSPLFHLTQPPLLLSVLLLIFVRSLFHHGVVLLVFVRSLFHHGVLLCHQSMALCKVAGKRK